MMPCPDESIHAAAACLDLLGYHTGPHRDVYLCLPATTEAGFSSGTEEETSGYESEGGHSLSPAATAECSTASSPSSPPLGRRPRTAFTAEQICSMERAFKKNAYLGTQDKAELCRKLNLSDKQVKVLTGSLCDW